MKSTYFSVFIDSFEIIHIVIFIDYFSSFKDMFKLFIGRINLFRHH